MNSEDWVESLRIVNCMSLADFKKCYGHEMGQHLFNKLAITYNRDLFKFLCYLDLSNQKALFDFVDKRMRG